MRKNLVEYNAQTVSEWTIGVSRENKQVVCLLSIDSVGRMSLHSVKDYNPQQLAKMLQEASHQLGIKMIIDNDSEKKI